MSLNSTLCKIIPSITLMIGLLAPTKIVKAVEDIPNNQTYTKQEALDGVQQTGKHQEMFELSQLVTSQKAQKIAFFSLMSLVSCNIYSKIKFQNNQNQEKQINKTEQDITYVKISPENTKSLTLVVDNSEKLNDQAKIELKKPSEQMKKAA